MKIGGKSLVNIYSLLKRQQRTAEVIQAVHHLRPQDRTHEMGGNNIICDAYARSFIDRDGIRIRIFV